MISEFVVQGGQSLTAGEAAKFRQHLAAYKLKAETLAATHHEKLRDETAFLLRFIEDVLDDAYAPDDFAAVPEAIFAVRYLAKEIDLIPDNLPGGLDDDAAVIGCVWENHEKEFRKYAAKNHIHLPK